MRIVVFARPVHNPAVPVEPSPTRTIEGLPGYQPIPNPMDELALEIGLSLRGKASCPVAVVACSVGRQFSRDVLKEFLACGADQAICIEEADWEPDGGIVAACLHRFYRNEPFDLGLFGSRDLDTGAGEVGPMFAALAGIPFIDSVMKVSWSGQSHLAVTRKQKRIRQEIRVTLPACLGIQRGAPLRYPSFWGKLKAETSGVHTVSPGDIERGPRVERQKFTPSKPRKGSVASAYAETSSVDRMRQALGITAGGKREKEDSLLQGSPEEMAQRALTLLKKEKMLDPQSF